MTDAEAGTPGGADRDRPLEIAVIAAALILFAPIVRVLLTRRVFVIGDLIGFHLPTRYLYAQALRAGDSPWWTPSLFGGFFLLGDGQAGMLHPLHYVLYRWLPLESALAVEVLAVYVFAFAGAVLFFRRVVPLPRAAALFGAMLFAFSGYHLILLQHTNAIAILAHLPWLLLAAHALMTSTRPRTRAGAFAGITVLVASQVLLAYPQHVMLAAIVAAAWTAARAIAVRSLTGIVPLVCAYACGVAIGGIQLLPTAAMLAESARATLTPAARLSYSMHPWQLVQLWAPQSIAMRGVAYDGMFCTLAIVFVLVRGTAPERRAARGALVFAAAAIVLALGRYGGVYRLLAVLPGFSLFRGASRFMSLAHAALALAGASAFAILARRWRSPRPLGSRTIAVLCIPLVLAIATAAIGPRSGWTLGGEGDWADGRHQIVSIAAWCVLTAAFAFAARGSRSALLVLPLLVSADLYAWGYRYIEAQPPATIAATLAGVSDPPVAGPGTRVAVFTSDADLYVMKGYVVTTGYAGLMPARTLDRASAEGLAAAGAAAVKDDSGWHLTRDAAPRARCADAGIARAMPLAVDRPGRIVVDTGSSPCALRLTESYDPGWRAVNEAGQALTLRRVDDCLAVDVPPGAGRVTLTFAPPSLARGMTVTLAGLLACAIGTVMMAKRRA